MYEIALKLLFTQSDLFLIRNQHKPFVISDLKSDVESDDSEDWKPKLKDFKTTSNFRRTLLKGVRPDIFDTDIHQSGLKKGKGGSSDSRQIGSGYPTN